MDNGKRAQVPPLTDKLFIITKLWKEKKMRLFSPNSLALGISVTLHGRLLLTNSWPTGADTKFFVCIFVFGCLFFVLAFVVIMSETQRTQGCVVIVE